MSKIKHIIPIDKLQIGVYVHLDLGWMQHPFSFNHFKIKNHDQIQTLHKLGLQSIRWIPERSDVNPLDFVETSALVPGEEDETNLDKELQAKFEHLRQLKTYHKKIEQVEKAFVDASRSARSIMRNAALNPKLCTQEATQLVQGIIDSLIEAPELSLQVISGKNGNASIYSHALNVSVLSIIFAHELGYDEDRLFHAGLAGMLHDIGLSKVPERVVNNRSDLTRVEVAARRQHCTYGASMARQAGLNEKIVEVINSHHECFDGSGYPDGLQGDQISELAQLVSLVNRYDNLCNPRNLSRQVTPHEALSIMYARQRGSFNPKLLQAFIRFMGVYPPGCVVNLSNDAVGLVIKVYATAPLRPTLILYNEQMPKNEAIILDLREEQEVNISKALNPSELPTAVFDYLSPQERINYYFDTA